MKRVWVTAMLVLVWVAPVVAADLMVFSGAGLMKPMEEMRKGFEGQNAVAVDVHYGSSGKIFGMLAAGQPCDVLVPGAAKYTMDALKNGWVEKATIRKLVLHLPAITVPKGNPAQIQGLEDLARKGGRVSIGDPKAPVIGRVSKKMLTNNRLWEQVQPIINVYAPTVNQLLIYVAPNQVDAAIIYGLKKYKPGNMDAAIREMAQSLKIDHLLHRKPTTLSGGEQQRAALARFLIVAPPLCCSWTSPFRPSILRFAARPACSSRRRSARKTRQ